MPSKPITIQGSKSWTRVFSQDWESEIGTISQKHTCSRMHIFWTIKRWKLWSEINVEMIFENRFLHSAKGESSEGPIQEITIGSWLKVPSLVTHSCVVSVQQNCQRRTLDYIFRPNILLQWYRYKPNGTCENISVLIVYTFLLWTAFITFLLWTAFMSSQ